MLYVFIIALFIALAAGLFFRAKAAGREEPSQRMRYSSLSLYCFLAALFALILMCVMALLSETAASL